MSTTTAEVARQESAPHPIPAGEEILFTHRGDYDEVWTLVQKFVRWSPDGEIVGSGHPEIRREGQVIGEAVQIHDRRCDFWVDESAALEFAPQEANDPQGIIHALSDSGLQMAIRDAEGMTPAWEASWEEAGH